LINKSAESGLNGIRVSRQQLDGPKAFCVDGRGELLVRQAAKRTIDNRFLSGSDDEIAAGRDAESAAQSSVPAPLFHA